MKAMVYHGNKDLRLENVGEPVPGPGEVKLRIDYCGICATDIEEYLYGPVFISAGTPHPLTGVALPLTIGHEMTGTVVERGQDGGTIDVGDRVVVNGVLTCGQCWWCKSRETTQCPSMAAVGFDIDGGLAEYMVWPASQVIRLPDSLSSWEAALTEPAAVAHHAVRRGRLGPGDQVAVLGAGTVGMLAMQAARAIGARVYVVDRRQMSLDLARDLGAEAAIDSNATDAGQVLRDLTDGVGVDVVIDAAGGEETPALAVQWVRRGGRAVLVAIYTSKPRYDFNKMVATEREMIGSLAYQQQDMEAAVGLIASGSVKTAPLVSGVIGLDEVVHVGYERMLAPAKNIFRLLVAPA